MKEKEFEKFKSNCKDLAYQILNCLDDDFRRYKDSDIENWANELKKLEEQNKSLKLTEDLK